MIRGAARPTHQKGGANKAWVPAEGQPSAEDGPRGMPCRKRLSQDRQAASPPVDPGTNAYGTVFTSDGQLPSARTQ
jgi:hypothetical protein